MTQGGIGLFISVLHFFEAFKRILISETLVKWCILNTTHQGKFTCLATDFLSVIPDTISGHIL